MINYHILTSTESPRTVNLREYIDIHHGKIDSGVNHDIESIILCCTMMQLGIYIDLDTVSIIQEDSKGLRDGISYEVHLSDVLLTTNDYYKCKRIADKLKDSSNASEFFNSEYYSYIGYSISNFCSHVQDQIIKNDVIEQMAKNGDLWTYGNR